MAIILEGKSTCPLCKAVLNSTKEFRMTPPITGNTQDALFELSDAGIHIDCLDKNPLKERLLHHIDLYRESLELREGLRCHVDGEQITDPREAIFLSLLTSDQTQELYQYNYLTFNKKNIKVWVAYNHFVQVCERFLSEGKWQGLESFNMLESQLVRMKEYRQ